MTTDEANKPGIRSYSGSIGLLIDRTTGTEEVLGSVWMIDTDTVATCGHYVAPFSEDCMNALKVKFPVSAQERGVSRALFHPQFQRKLTARLTKQTIADMMPAIPVQKHNVVVLKLTELHDISADEKARINQKLTLPQPPMEQGLMGSLSEIDLALVIQTITNARKEGLLLISDERNRPQARIFCQSGRVMHALYKNLTNEMAIYQIIARNILGNFFFQSTQEPDWPVKKPIMRPTDMLLIESHRRLDEIDKLLTGLGGHNAHYCKAIPEVNARILPPEVQDYANLLWNYIDGATPIGQLWQLANLDDYAIFLTMNELFKTRQIENARETGAYLTQEMSFSGELAGFAMMPIPIMQQAPLAPWDEIQNLTVDSLSGRPRVRVGSLLGTLRPMDPWHLVHNIKLLPEASGSPLFKQGSVIGMHCGNLPFDPENSGAEEDLQQMLWVESILECLKEGGEQELAQRISSTGEDLMRQLSVSDVTGAGTGSGTGAGVGTQEVSHAAAQPSQTTTGSTKAIPSAEPGCREVARIHCAKCGRTSLDSARFCKLCGSKLLQDMELEPKSKKPAKSDSSLVPVLLCIVVLGVLAFGGVWLMKNMPKGGLPAMAASASNNAAITLPESPWLSIGVHGIRRNEPKWTLRKPGTNFTKDTQIHIKVRALDPCFVYLLYRGSSENNAHLIHPDDPVRDVRMDHGQEFTYPSTIEGLDAKGQKVLNGLAFSGPPGTETVIALASHSQLAEMKDPAKLDGVFQKALSILTQAGAPDGVEVDGNVLDAGLIPPAKDGLDNGGTEVFLQRLKINHSD